MKTPVPPPDYSFEAADMITVEQSTCPCCEAPNISLVRQR